MVRRTNGNLTLSDGSQALQATEVVMQNKKYDAIVLGVGGVGSAALYQLAGRGLRVLGIDRFAPGHSHGSSHGETRAIRKAYFEHPDYVPLLTRAYELWQDLNEVTGKALIQQTGILEIGPTGGILLTGIRTAAEQHHLAIDALSASDVIERFPGFLVPRGYGAVFEPDGGYLLVEECVQHQVELSLRLGAELAIGSGVRSWKYVNGDVHVKTDAETFVARKLVIAAGAWSNDLLWDWGVNLRVLRKHMHWYEAKPSSYCQERGSPVFFYETPGGCYYGFPVLSNRVGVSDPGESVVKIAEHSGGELVRNPLLCDRNVDAVDRQRVEKFMRENMPAMTGQARSHAVCMYTMTDDEQFVVDRHPDNPNVLFAAGLSGHGFKFTPVLAECLADWVEEKQTHRSIGFLSANRFKK